MNIPILLTRHLDVTSIQLAKIGATLCFGEWNLQIFDLNEKLKFQFQKFSKKTKAKAK